jgi:hypothetical protein
MHNGKTAYIALLTDYYLVDEIKDDKLTARTTSTVSVGTREGKKLPGRPRYRSKDNTLYSERMEGSGLYFLVHYLYDKGPIVETV